jgi:hypothetical protein
MSAFAAFISCPNCGHRGEAPSLSEPLFCPRCEQSVPIPKELVPRSAAELWIDVTAAVPDEEKLQAWERFVQEERIRREESTATIRARIHAAFDDLLGKNCPPTQLGILIELYRQRMRFRNEETSEEGLIRLVYWDHDDWNFEMTEDALRRYRPRLRADISRLNQRLLKRERPFAIVRPRHGFLTLSVLDTSRPHLLPLDLENSPQLRLHGRATGSFLRKGEPTDREIAEARRELNLALGLNPDSTDPIAWKLEGDDDPKGLADACERLRQMLEAQEEVPVKQLENEWKASGGKRGSLWYFLKKLGVSRKKHGFGKGAFWSVSLWKA